MQEIVFNGVVGRLEGRFHKAENPKAPMVLVLHPNPAQGGTMNNKVAYTMFQAFCDMGFSVLRFNFRGVGNSQGALDATGVGELADAIVALDWLQNRNLESNQCWIAGYSFGAWIAAQVLMRRPEVRGFVFVTPPTTTYDFGFLTPCPASGLLVQGGKDIIVEESSVEMLAEQLGTNKLVRVEYKTIAKADHLYTNALKDLYDTICGAVPDISKGIVQKVPHKIAHLLADDYV
ncbi:MAG: alpha/beta hydrolase [Alphaproteobacteria bacterium]|nr:alpha/beta hydrolase [Alphaproteobacteria bacterium]